MKQNGAKLKEDQKVEQICLFIYFELDCVEFCLKFYQNLPQTQFEQIFN